jgi:hypothetical protein
MRAIRTTTPFNQLERFAFIFLLSYHVLFIPSYTTPLSVLTLEHSDTMIPTDKKERKQDFESLLNCLLPWKTWVLKT